MSGSLATIAPDCLSNLILYLNGDEFASLMITGNRLLRHKLTLNCHELSFQLLHCNKFPFAALELPKLRSLAVSSVQRIAAYLDFRQDGEKALTRGSKSLEKLDLRFCNAHGLLLSPGRSLPRLSVRDRFPSLTTCITRNSKL